MVIQWVNNYTLLDDPQNNIYFEGAASFLDFNSDKSKTSIQRLEVYWFEDEPVGWALFISESAARDVAEPHHSATGGFTIVPIEEKK